MVLQSPSSSSSSFSYGFTYQVFLSFRGTDTRYGFTGNLFKALDGNGIHTFIDDRELHGGDEITPSLFNAIEESRIFIPVFSINYASSSFCLDELAHIVECSKAKGRLVVPVFYDVEPSHVRRQTDSYGVAISKHEERFQNNTESYGHNMKMLQKWKTALTQAANLSGHHFKIGSEYEHEFIGKIVKFVSNKISREPLFVANYPVGLESRVLRVKSLIDERSDDEVHIIGICGIGGVGKTTLAKQIYNVIADQFECLCFLHDVRENSAKNNSKHLQEMLLSKTVGLDINLGDVSEGIPIIKQRLHRKKVLLILDDVDKPKQLRVLAGGLDWFGPGSRVIVTTRDKHLLASHGIESTYEVDELDKKEALELLRLNAFKNNIVDSSYEDILNRTVAYASGLPLALEVVGSDLFGKPIEHWESALNCYREIPNNEIQEILKVSFDALDEYGRSVFLDIACCFKGHRLAEIKDILHAHYGKNMEYHIGILFEKSLIKIDKRHFGYTDDDGEVTLHDLIEDMGKEIVRQESPREPGKRSRLWFHEDIIQVLKRNKGTSQIETIYLDIPLSEEQEVKWNGNGFKKMENLKTLIIKSGRFSRVPKHLPSGLRVLEWRRYPFPNIPFDFCQKKLSICNLPETSFDLSSSLMAKTWPNMRVLNFNLCLHLTQIPDVSGLPNLETISFAGCDNLIEIHGSVGHLNKLKTLNARTCPKLRSFPPLALPSLQELVLLHCTSLENFPEILRETKHLKRIELNGTSLKKLPPSIENLTGLSSLHIWGYEGVQLPNTILMMPKLSGLVARGCQLPKYNDKTSSMVFSKIERLELLHCRLSNECLPAVFEWFANVKYLELSHNDFTILPECLKECHNLVELVLDECELLQEIRGIPPKLKGLSAKNCRSLTSSCRSNLLNQEPHEPPGTEFCLAGTARMPEWFEHQRRVPSISFWCRNKLPSVALFVVRKSRVEDPPPLKTKLIINGRNYDVPGRGGIVDHYGLIESNHTYLQQLHDSHGEFGSVFKEALSKNEWNHVTLTLNKVYYWPEKCWTPGSDDIEMGIHIFKQDCSMEDIQFTNHYEEERKLDEGWVKVNCCVAVSDRPLAMACGGILRDQLGSFLGGFAGQLGKIPILHAELKAILYGIQFAWNRGYRKVTVESDLPYAIELLREECPPPDFSCCNLVREIHIFSSSAGKVVWSHTSRERNWEAYGFAKHGLELSWKRGLVIFDDVPSFILEILDDDDDDDDDL